MLRMGSLARIAKQLLGVSLHSAGRMYIVVGYTSGAEPVDCRLARSQCYRMVAITMLRYLPQQVGKLCILRPVNTVHAHRYAQGGVGRSLP